MYVRSICLCAALLLAPAVYAQPAPPPPKPRVEALIDALAIDPLQRNAVRALLATQREEMEALQAQLAEVHRLELLDLLTPDQVVAIQMLRDERPPPPPRDCQR